MDLNNQSFFSHIYRELLSKSFDLYLNNKSKKPDLTDDNESGSSIDSFISLELEALISKIMNIAFTITDRLKIHEQINYKMNYNWFDIKNKILGLNNSVFDKYYNGGSGESRESQLENQLLTIDKHILDEKVRCWSDLVNPMENFIDHFHKLQALKQDKKLLE